MKIFLISYLSIGILSNIIGPSAKKLNSVVKETRSATITRLLNKPKVKKREDLFIEVILRILAILFFPILYISLVVEYFRFSYTSPSMKKILNDPHLYYWRMGGFGTIRCFNCDFEQDIVSFLHRIDDWKTGYQCQKCGKFQVIENETHGSDCKKCDCGGDLEREKPIFCPRCKTTHVSYRLKYIT
jgi:hypothetical protein